MRATLLAGLCLMAVSTAGFAQTKPSGECGEVVTIQTHDKTTMSSIDACVGRSPHGFVDQEAEVAAGIARFVRGGSF
jgi:hypothetical protein